MTSALEILYKAKIFLAIQKKPLKKPQSPKPETTLLPQMKTTEFCCDLVIPVLVGHDWYGC